MTRNLLVGGALLVGMALLLLLDPAAVAAGWRAAFLSVGAPVFGAVLMLMIARVVETDWSAMAVVAMPLPVLAFFALAIFSAQFASQLPDHLEVWANPVFVAARTLVAVAALWFASSRLAAGASRSFAAVALAVWTVAITPLAYDWMLGGELGHPVSAVGMMLTAEQVGGAGAAVLAFGLGGARLRSDLSWLLIAAALGLSYMIFMDYLIKWYADLPSQVEWYLARGGAMAWLATGALVLGLFGPIATLAFLPGETGRRVAGLQALAGLFLANLWWVGAGRLAALAALLGTAGIGLCSLAFVQYRTRQEARLG
ncbi:hypothetical protein HT136_04435 [Novosphingobium profundi]|uniref:hypothetical protein n=1 Tax=Novosphingobium profundi TaxID=1774954 RepID=UPI001BDB56F7|nr:hypothetical protein [Novosphingobium profundi]MBT0667612.1 hypothetical protein [Novosphingobium profundi]